MGKVHVFGGISDRVETIENNIFNTYVTQGLEESDLVPINQTIMDHEARIAALEQGVPSPAPLPGPTPSPPSGGLIAAQGPANPPGAASGGTGGPDNAAHFDSDFASDVYDGTINSPWTSSDDHEATLVAPGTARVGNKWEINPTSGQLVAWINSDVQTDPNSDRVNHRLYPPWHGTLQTPLVASFLFFLDVNYAQLPSGEWISLLTLDDTNWSTTKAWSILAGGTPYWWGNGATWDGGDHSSDVVQTKVWHRATFYAEFNTSSDSYFDMWLDGTKVSEVVVTNNLSSANVIRMHAGLYTSTGVTKATYMMKDLIIWRLASAISIANRGDVGDTNSEPVVLS